MNKKGQASAELVILLPLMIFMAGLMLSIAYICWQGIKVQQAANLAARMEGQERVSGGTTTTAIQDENGLGRGLFGDTPPQDLSAAIRGTPLGGQRPPPGNTVFGKFYKVVQNMFGPDEQRKLFIPEPHAGINTDQVEVIRVLIPPKFMNVQLPSVKLDATAYGGEDPHMYGLPRWGQSGGSNDPFYVTAIHNPQQQ